MKVVILCGGHGTRLGDLTSLEPKPMVRIGKNPILIHIMEMYSAYGFDDFILLTGYKSQKITQFFLNIAQESNDISINLLTGKLTQKDDARKPWQVRIINTGLYTNTAGRLKKIQHLFKKHETFFCTYGDGLANLNILDLLSFHKKNDAAATMTAVRPHSRFGALTLKENKVLNFSEKPKNQMDWINGGFFIFNTNIFNFFEDNEEALETGPLVRLAEVGQLNAYFHYDFWQCMDTARDFYFLSKLANSDNPPWKME